MPPVTLRELFVDTVIGILACLPGQRCGDGEEERSETNDYRRYPVPLCLLVRDVLGRDSQVRD